MLEHMALTKSLVTPRRMSVTSTSRSRCDTHLGQCPSPSWPENTTRRSTMFRTHPCPHTFASPGDVCNLAQCFKASSGVDFLRVGWLVGVCPV